MPQPANTTAPAEKRDEQLDRVCGTVLRVTYHNEENDYRVIKLMPLDRVDRKCLDSRGEVVLVGRLPGIVVGETVEAAGHWASHAKHGPQFKAQWFKPNLPTGARGIEAYLRSGALKGVGEVLAGRIVAAFGADTFDVLDTQIEKLTSVKGITGKRFDQIRTSWLEARGDRELITFLGEHGISAAWAKRLRKAYGEAALSVVRSNPYRLAAEVRGIGFHRADIMARRIGIPLDSPERAEAALGHLLESQAGEGHTFLTRERLLELALELLGTDRQQIKTVLDAMLAHEQLIAETIDGIDAIFLVSLHDAETGAAHYLRNLSQAEPRTPRINVREFLERFEREKRVQLSDEQRSAVEHLARTGLLVLTGGPGTGKTTTLRSVIELFQAARRTVRLAAPTGRAARRLTETSKAPAETIHRMLGYQAHADAFNHDETNPLEADLVVIDEASMLDVMLANDLFRALRPGTCLLLVGDEDQLPSVGPGSVLRDIMASGYVPVARLHQVFRQAEASMIVRNAHRINGGQFPVIEPARSGEDPDFFFIERDEPSDVLQTIKTLVAERIPSKFHLDPINDVQVLSPMRRGELGVESINLELQSVLNPARQDAAPAAKDEDGEEEQFQRLRAGDRVMQTKNDYEKDVANGDIGAVVRVDATSGEVVVKFDQGAISYLADEARQLRLAYAVTIHKSQGSEYPAVVIPIHMQHYIMLQRNLIYTALTRARRLVCLVGSKKALWKAIGNSTRAARNSGLVTFIKRKN